MSVEKAALCQPADEKSVPPHLRCNFCSKPVFNSYQTPHGCRLCQTCVSTKLHPSEKRKCPGTTEACRDEEEEIMINQGSCLPDIATRREISKLTVTCPNKDDGCKEQFKWRDFDTHLEKCDYEKDTCRSELTRNGPSIRLREKCSEEFLRQRVKCDMCLEWIVNNEMWTSHRNLSSSTCCSKYSDFCPYCKDKGTKLNPSAYANHLKACPEKPIDCRYAHIGCNKKAKKSDLDKHYKEDVDQHLTLILRQLQTTSYNQEIGIAKAKLASLHEQFMQLQVEVFDRTLSILVMEKIANDLFGGIAEMSCFLQNLCDKINRQQSAMTETDSRVQTTRSFEIDNGNAVRQELNKVVPCRLLSLEHSQSNFAEGFLVWKVNCLSKRRREAIDGRVVSIFSEPFLLRRNSFLFRVRLFLNGSESGAGTNVSVYLVLMQHEFDDIQVWPLRADVTFRLINLKNRSADITKTVRFDTGNQRPSSREDLSVCCGEPNFCSRDKLEGLSTPFVKNDNLFLEVEVADIQIRPGRRSGRI